MINKNDLVLICCLYFFLSSTVFSEVTQSVHPETGLRGWKLNQDDFELELIQRLPDQTRGFFQARGFSAAITNKIATSCVLQTIVRNKGSQQKGKPITVSLKQWRVDYKGKNLSIKLKEQWNSEWPANRVSNTARIAFRWSTFPTEQIFYPAGDYNWGMISFNLPPGEKFNLKLEWTIAQQIHHAVIKNIECPKDK